MKAIAPAILTGVLLVSFVSVTMGDDAQKEEGVLQQHELKIDGMT